MQSPQRLCEPRREEWRIEDLKEIRGTNAFAAIQYIETINEFDYEFARWFHQPCTRCIVYKFNHPIFLCKLQGWVRPAGRRNSNRSVWFSVDAGFTADELYKYKPSFKFIGPQHPSVKYHYRPMPWLIVREHLTEEPEQGRKSLTMKEEYRRTLTLAEHGRLAGDFSDVGSILMEMAEQGLDITEFGYYQEDLT